MELEQFSKLEEKVKNLIERYKELKGEKEQIENELKLTKQRLNELETEISRLKETRKEVLKRVDDLIRRLEEEGSKTAEAQGD